ncbi:MAG: pilus assembly protein PilP [Myxococcales bacterium]|jgi:Tfp pilus assembly protein PilP
MLRLATACAASLLFLASPSSRAEPATRAKATSPEDSVAQPVAARPAARDPFKQEIEVVLPPPPPSCGKLCEYDVDQLRVAVLVTGMTTPIAGLEAPNGKVYVVDRGTAVGKRGGKVVEISGRRIVVEEPCRKGGAVATCRVVLEIPEAKVAPEENLLRR